MKTIKDDHIKEEIINQAQILFKQFGLKKTTMDEIALACGKAKSTLYHYFKNKEEVFDTVLEKELINLRAAVNEEVKKQSSLQNKLQSYFLTFHQETLNKINLYRVLKQDLRIELTNKNRFDNIIKFETNYVNDLLNKGIESGEFTGLKKEDTRWFSEIIIVSFLGIVKHTIEKEGEFDISNLYKITDVLISRLII